MVYPQLHPIRREVLLRSAIGHSNLSWVRSVRAWRVRARHPGALRRTLFSTRHFLPPHARKAAS
jgi:hypothetical protein